MKVIPTKKDSSDLIYRLQFLQECFSTSIEFSKERYYAKILNRLNKTKKTRKHIGLC